jgi:cysteine desulfuration protein SufE
MPSIKELEEEIISEFEILGDDRESTIFYIMELGDKLPVLPEKFKIDENLIKGCQSKVWLTANEDNGKVRFLADSNTDITKGLISLLIRVLDGQPRKEIINADLAFLNKIGMDQVIGSQRSNGLASMIRQMKMFALALETQNSANA